MVAEPSHIRKIKNYITPSNGNDSKHLNDLMSALLMEKSLWLSLIESWSMSLLDATNTILSLWMMMQLACNLQ
jgi:hypothetical protein